MHGDLFQTGTGYWIEIAANDRMPNHGMGGGRRR